MFRWQHYFMLICLVLCCNISYAIDETVHTFSSRNNALRFENLTKEIRCLVCQNQNIADSSAPLAIDLREKIYQQIIENKSDTEIKDYLVKRYGEFILLNPRLNKFTVVLWAFPLFAIALVGFILFRVCRVD